MMEREGGGSEGGRRIDWGRDGKSNLPLWIGGSATERHATLEGLRG